MSDTQTLRRHLKQARRSLPPAAAAESQREALARLRRHPAFVRARRIAGYVGSKGELDPMPLLLQAHELGKQVYLPRLHPYRPGRLWFYRWTPGTRMQPNRYGIPEPLARRERRLAARWLDLVIVPLLGFDADCHRLGMGGGYYDRTFAFRRQNQQLRRPLLIGLAHELQQVDAIAVQPWDVVLDGVVTARHSHQRTQR